MSRVKDTGRYVLFSAQKNEMPFLLEWIAFHKVIGFTDIIIFSNDCDDGSDIFLDQLAALGEIQHYAHTPKLYSPQIAAEHEARRRNLFIEGDWVMWLDTDEFLVLQKPVDTVQKLINFIYPADAIGLNWVIFGDAGVKQWPGRQIDPIFNRAAFLNFARHRNIKTLFQYSEKIERLELHRPILKKEFNSIEHFKFVNGANQLERKMPYELFGGSKDGLKVPRHAIKVHGRYQLGQINHYMVRNREMFELKKRRGRGYQSPVGGSDEEFDEGANSRHKDDYYKMYNRNEKTNERILPFLPALDAEIERILDRIEQMDLEA